MRDRTAEVEVVAAPTGLEELKEALVKLFWELIPNSKVRKSGYSRTQTQEFPWEEVGVCQGTDCHQESPRCPFVIHQRFAFKVFPLRN